MSPHVYSFSPAEIHRKNVQIKSYKAPGYKFILQDVLRHFPEKAVVLLVPSKIKYRDSATTPDNGNTHE